MVDGNPPADDEEDHKDNLLRRRADEEVAMKAFRLTREKDQQFAIDLGDGREVRDRRPLAGNARAGAPSQRMSAADASQRLNANSAAEELPIRAKSAANATTNVGAKTDADPAAVPAADHVVGPDVDPDLDRDARSATPSSPSSASPAPAKQKPVKLTPYMQARLQLQAENFGVIIQPDGALLEYIRDVNGRELSLFTEPATEQGLNSAETKLKRMAEDMMNFLAAKYGVTFSKADEVVNEAAGSLGRQPNLIEIDAMGEALSVSDPAHHTAEQGRVKICFVESKKKSEPVVSLYLAANVVAILVLPDATKLGRNRVHSVACLFVECLAAHTVHKTGSAQIQSLPGLVTNIANFRSGVAERRLLLKQSKQSYDKAKEIDQWEINKEYGLQPDGTELKVRLPNGKLVNNKAEMREEITRFEQGVP